MQLKFGGLNKILILLKRVMRLMSFNEVCTSTPGLCKIELYEG